MINKGVNPNAHVRIYTPSIIKLELAITGYKVEKPLRYMHSIIFII